MKYTKIIIMISHRHWKKSGEYRKSEQGAEVKLNKNESFYVISSLPVFYKFGKTNFY